MSARNFIAQFRKRIAVDSGENTVSDEQRREFLRQALADLSDEKPLANHHATVSVIAGEPNVRLPRDYRFAEQAALLAVEYGYSAEYAAALDIDSGIYNYSANRPVAGYGARLRYVGALPAPLVTEESIYGVTRQVLKLHRNSESDRDETLIYHANYYVSDPITEIILEANLAASDTVVITVRANNATTVYTYTAVTSTPASNQFKIGLSAAATAANLAALIVANVGTTGLTAEVEGQVVRVTGDTSDPDYTITSSSANVTIESVPAYNNLDSNVAARVFKLMQSQYFDYLGTDPSQDGILSDQVRNLYLQKSVRLREQALDKFTMLTI
jgi:hypothetical protein